MQVFDRNTRPERMKCMAPFLKPSVLQTAPPRLVHTTVVRRSGIHKFSALKLAEMSLP